MSRLSREGAMTKQAQEAVAAVEKARETVRALAEAPGVPFNIRAAAFRAHAALEEAWCWATTARALSEKEGA